MTESDKTEVEALAAEIRRQMLTPGQRFAIFLSFIASAGVWLLLALPAMSGDSSDYFDRGPSGGTVAAVMASFLLIPVLPVGLMTYFSAKAKRPS